MTKFAQNLTAAFAAVLIVTATFIPVLTVPPAHTAATIIPALV